MTRRTMAERKRRGAERDARRESLFVLLSRMQRGALLEAERPLLRAHVEAELAESDELRRTVAGQQTAIQRTGRRLEAAEDAIREAEQRAADAEEQLRMYRVVYGPDAMKVHRAAEQRAEQAEQALAAMRQQLYDTQLRRDDARAGREDAEKRASTAELEATKAEAALAHVRNAQTLGEALAAVARYDGLTTEAAAAHAAFTDAADSTRARLDEQAREHAIELATMARRARTAEAALTRVCNARQWADVWSALGMYYGWTPEEAGQQARGRRLESERRAERYLAEARDWRVYCLAAEQRAARHLAAWQSARRRARATATELERIHGWLAHWADRARAAEPRLDRLAGAWRSARRRAQERTRDAYANAAEYREAAAALEQHLATCANEPIGYALADQ